MYVWIQLFARLVNKIFWHLLWLPMNGFSCHWRPEKFVLPITNHKIIQTACEPGLMERAKGKIQNSIPRDFLQTRFDVVFLCCCYFYHLPYTICRVKCIGNSQLRSCCRFFHRILYTNAAFNAHSSVACRKWRVRTHIHNFPWTYTYAKKSCSNEFWRDQRTRSSHMGINRTLFFWCVFRIESRLWSRSWTSNAYGRRATAAVLVTSDVHYVDCPIKIFSLFVFEWRMNGISVRHNRFYVERNQLTCCVWWRNWHQFHV